jgi:lysophospholipase L1-like esterase
MRGQRLRILSCTLVLLFLGDTAAGAEPVLPRVHERLRTGQPLKIVCLGDSVTGIYYHTGGRRAYPEMLPLALQKVFPEAAVAVINAGISGNSTRDGLRRLDKDVLAHKPNLVTVMFGLNDCARLPIDEYRTNLITIIHKCRAIDADVMLCTPNGVLETTGRPVKKIREYGDVMHTIAREEKVAYCDVFAAYQAFQKHDEKAWRLLLSDEIHPNMDGHKLTACEICQAITGRSVTLNDVGPLQPAVPRIRARIKAGEPIKILAMPPYDTIIGPVLRKLAPAARVEISTWPTADRNLHRIEKDAEPVRKKGVDLVLIAVPASASATSEEQTIRSWSWILNWSLSFGLQQWDVVGISAAVANDHLTPEERMRDEFARRMLRAQDLSMIERPTGRDASAEQILTDWLRQQLTDAAK